MAVRLWQTLLDLEFDRRDKLVCLGGGVITDLGGFVGSTYKRGIKTYHIPTSLLGMVDASIGGKTGINFQGFKNQVGTFNGEIKTLICPQFLSSLPQEELLSGFAEMIKHAVLDGTEHLEKLLKLGAVDANSLSPLIEQSARFKERIVALDFQESGARQQLNFGHTIGHAIEAFSHAKDEALTHGHCVALGMLVELILHDCQTEDFDFLQSSVRKLVTAHFDTTPLAKLSAEKLLPYLLHDKKNQGESVMMTQLEGVGKYTGVTPINMDNLDRVIASISE